MPPQMADWSDEFDPTDLDGQRERGTEKQRNAMAAAIAEREDIVWLLSGRRGRRLVRRQLKLAGVFGRISSSFNTNFGQMCHTEGLRNSGFLLLERILGLLASGELPLESYQRLMNEIDDDE